MARTLADAGLNATFSYAGRTAAPVPQPLPLRIGGFGGADGLQRYLTDTKTTHVIDATHPFAAQMSRNAHAATQAMKLPLIRLERAPWTVQTGDTWQTVKAIEDAPSALPDSPKNVFLAIGKQNLDLFTAKPQHHYLLRLVDPPETPIPLPRHTITLARGPYDVTRDTALLEEHKITHLISKNAGGTGAAAKIEAARALGIKVIIVDRPTLPETCIARSVSDVMHWLSHTADRGV